MKTSITVSLVAMMIAGAAAGAAGAQQRFGFDPDVNGDGKIDGNDFISWQRHQGTSTGTAAELAAWTMIANALLNLSATITQS